MLAPVLQSLVDHEKPEVCITINKGNPVDQCEADWKGVRRGCTIASEASAKRPCCGHGLDPRLSTSERGIAAATSHGKIERLSKITL